MTTKRTLILLLGIIAQALCAPSICTESCRSYQTQQTNSDLTQQLTNLDGLSQVSGLDSGLLNFDNTRPGNWTEQNQYRTDGGRGRVYEEKGQVVKGPTRVRFFKKNYTSSYSTGDAGGFDSLNQGGANLNYGGDSTLQSASSLNENVFGGSSLDTRRTYGARQSNHASKTTDSRSERLEDFGEFGAVDSGLRVAQRSDLELANGRDSLLSMSRSSPDDSARPGNWSTVDTYRTDGGHGKVYEEQGQTVTGPKRTRYYRKNYTSSYTTGGALPAQTELSSVTDLEREMQRLHKQFDSFGREIHQFGTTYVGGSEQRNNLGTAQSSTRDINNAGYGRDYLQTTENLHGGHDLTLSPIDQGSTTDRETSGYRRTVSRHETSSSSVQKIYDHDLDGGTTLIPQSTYVRPALSSDDRVIGEQPGRVQPSGYRGAGNEQQSYENSYGNEDYQISQQVNQLPDSYGLPSRRVPATGGIFDRGENHATAGSLSKDHSHVFSGYVTSIEPQIGQSQTTQTEEDEYRTSHASTGSMSRGGQSQMSSGYVGTVQPAGSRHYESSHWSSHQRTVGGSAIPEFTTGASQMQESQQIQTIAGHRTAGSSFGQRYDRTNRYVGQSSGGEGNYDLAYETRPGELVTGVLDANQMTQGADCDQATAGQDVRHATTKYRRVYKRATPGRGRRFDDSWIPGRLESEYRGDHSTQQTQRSEDLAQQSQRSEDLTQQTSGFEDLTQQTQPTGDLIQQNQRSEDLTQQSQRSEDLIQQSQLPEDLTQQTSGFEDLTQQTQPTGDLIQQNQRSEDLTQQSQRSEDLTQQSQRSEDLIQQSRLPEDLTQQTQRSEDFTQQTSGKIENLGQQSQQPLSAGKPQRGNLDALTQQTDFTEQTSGKLEFGPQSQIGGFEDSTQQLQKTSGNLELGQQSQRPWSPGKSRGESLEDLTQQTGGSNKLTQQTSGKIENLGQQSQQPWSAGKPQRGNLDDLTQQTDFTEQTSGKLEFGPQSQTDGFEDSTQQLQQTSGNLNFGQQSERPWSNGEAQRGHPEVLLQQEQTTGNLDFRRQSQNSRLPREQTAVNFEDPTQQTSGKLEFERQSRNSWSPREPQDIHSQDLTRQSENFEEFAQQTSGNLEFGQETQHPWLPRKPHDADSDDFAQQNSSPEDFTRHTSANLELSQQTQNPWSSREPQSLSSADLTRSDGNVEDLTQQTSGNPNRSRYPQNPWLSGKPQSGHHAPPSTGNKGLAQKTGEVEDLTRENPESWRYSQNPWLSGKPQNERPESPSVNVEDLTQQTGGVEDFAQQAGDDFEDLTQQTSRNVELTGQTQKPWFYSKPYGGNSHNSRQQPSGQLELGGKPRSYSNPRTEQHNPSAENIENIAQQSQNTWRPEHGRAPNSWKVGNLDIGSQRDEDLTQRSSTDDDDGDTQRTWQPINPPIRENSKPAPKPKPRRRPGMQTTTPEPHSDNSEERLVPISVDDDSDSKEKRGGDPLRGDQPPNFASASQTKPLIEFGQETQQNQDLRQQFENVESLESEEQRRRRYGDQESQRYGENFEQQSGRDTFEDDRLGQQVQREQDVQMLSDDLQLTKKSVGDMGRTPEEDDLKVEPRILLAYGGGGFDRESRGEDFYDKVKPGPNVILSPDDGRPTFLIDETPRTTTTTIPVPEVSTTEVIAETPLPPPPPPPFPSVWQKIGNRVTSSFDKAKDKVQGWFGSIG